MASYFRQVPNFEYVNRNPDAKIGDFLQVKNLFKRGKLREDIFQNLTFFTKYEIKGNDRPDNVAFEVYNDATLDWLVLICNNIVNVQSEWPLPQSDFDRIMLEKYETYENLYNGIHHYETSEVKNSQGATIVPKGKIVDSEYSITYYDYFIDSLVDTGNLATPVTNYEYEEKIENNKRNIYVLKPIYLNVVFDDMLDIMTYKKGSTQYISGTLKRADNIKLYS